MAKFTFTQPKTKNGVSDFYSFLIMLSYNKISGKRVRTQLFKHITFQNLRDAGLIKYTNSEYSLTDKGHRYIAKVKSNDYTREDLRTIIKG